MSKVSVIVPCYNHARFLKQRIDSILNQTYQDFELILLDDHSTDDSYNICLSYKDNPHVVHVETNKQNSGKPFKQWEKGIRLAKGEYIWIAESDDYAGKEFLSNTVCLLDQHPEARLCLTGSYIVDEKGESIPDREADTWEADGTTCIFSSNNYLPNKMMVTNSVYNASMVLFRKEGCLSDITPRYREMRYCGDWLFWIEQIRKGGVIELHRKLNYFRQHGHNTTNKGAEEGNSLGEIAFIRHWLHRHCVTDKTLADKDRVLFYRTVRNFPVSTPQRKKELLNCIAKEGRFTYRNYCLAKLRLKARKLFGKICF